MNATIPVEAWQQQIVSMILPRITLFERGNSDVAIGGNDGRVYAGRVPSPMQALSVPRSEDAAMIGKRVRLAREAVGLSQAELARRLDTSSAQMSRLENGERRIDSEWARRISPHVGLSPQEILFGQDVAHESLPAELPKSNQSVTAVPLSRVRVKEPYGYVQLRGEASAGSWLEPEMAHTEPRPTQVPIVPTHAHLPQYAYQIVGASMDELRIFDGALVVCIPPDDLKNGDVVIVERSRGQLVERSCKRYRRIGDAIELSPRSTDPRYQTIVYRPGETDDETVTILGKVILATTYIAP